MNSYATQLAKLMDSKASPDAFMDLATSAYRASRGQRSNGMTSEPVSVLLEVDDGVTMAKVVNWCSEKGVDTIGELASVDLHSVKNFGAGTFETVLKSVNQICGDIPLNSIVSDPIARHDLKRAGILWWRQCQSAKLRQLSTEARFAVMWMREFNPDSDGNFMSPPVGSAGFMPTPNPRTRVRIQSAKVACHEQTPFDELDGELIYRVITYSEGDWMSAVAITNKGASYDLLSRV